MLLATLLLCVLCASTACGGGSSATPPPSNLLSGNFEISLARHLHPDEPLILTGFLQQTGTSISGSVIFNGSPIPGGGCSGVGPVTGGIDGQNLSLSINEFGQDVSLTGTVPSVGAALGGQYSTIAGACIDFSTGTWSAVQVKPIAGPFHGTLVSPAGTVEVTGTLDQGSNTGASNAPLSGSITAGTPAPFCAYLTTATVTGFISGTAVTLNLFSANGTQISQIPATVSTDGTALTGTYVFPKLSKNCLGDEGTIQLTFP